MAEYTTSVLARRFIRLARLRSGTDTAGLFLRLEMILRRLPVLMFCLIAGMPAARAQAETAAPEPTREECIAAVEEARSLAVALPADDLSRIFAESQLAQAMREAGNGEFDECVEYAERATIEAKEYSYKLRPGEKLKVLQPNEYPDTPPAANAGK